jgi:hypothetical protein
MKLLFALCSRSKFIISTPRDPYYYYQVNVLFINCSILMNHRSYCSHLITVLVHLQPGLFPINPQKIECKNTFCSGRATGPKNRVTSPTKPAAEDRLKRWRSSLCGWNVELEWRATTLQSPSRYQIHTADCHFILFVPHSPYPLTSILRP